MRSSHYCLLILAILILISHAAEFQLEFTAKVPNQKITSGDRTFNATATIPDMFIYSNTSQQQKSKQRRLKEIAPSPTTSPTPAPTIKVPLPVIILIPPEGAQDKSVSIYGSQFNMNIQYSGKIFQDLKNKLVSSGKMAVIQYDKRNCKSSDVIGYHGGLSQYTGAQPMCTHLCPNFCPNAQNVCNLNIGCYNDTNLTLNDIISDAQQVFTQSIGKMKKYLDADIVDFSQIYSIPVGFSFQGAAIATYLASHADISTAISLMGSSLPIDALLEIQLTHNNMKYVNVSAAAQHAMFEQLQTKLECIKNGTFPDQKLVDIYNNFLLENDTKLVSYWRDWLSLTKRTDYDSIMNFMSINSYNDKQVPPVAYLQLRDLFSDNATVEMNTLNNINHFMIDLEQWNVGKWVVDDRVAEHVIHFVNDICGYLDKINEWILWNNSHPNVTGAGGRDEVSLIENDTIYKVLLYTAIMVIVLILACGIYFIIAKKVCPYEFEDISLNEDDGRDEDRERRRRRRRRHRRHRRSAHRHGHVRNMVELNEPMIQSVLGGDNENENEHENESIGNGPALGPTEAQNEILNQYVD